MDLYKEQSWWFNTTQTYPNTKFSQNISQFGSYICIYAHTVYMYVCIWIRIQMNKILPIGDWYLVTRILWTNYATDAKFSNAITLAPETHTNTQRCTKDTHTHVHTHTASAAASRRTMHTTYWLRVAIVVVVATIKYSSFSKRTNWAQNTTVIEWK